MSGLNQSKAAIVPGAAAWEIRNFTITGCGISATTHTLVAAVRCHNHGYGVVRNCRFMGNQNGFAANSGMRWVIELIDVHLENNGLNDGLTHNLYVNNGVKLTLRNVTSINPRGGHAIKSRCHNLEVHGGQFESVWASPFDFSEGGAFLIAGAHLLKRAESSSRSLLTYAIDGTNGGDISGIVIRNSVVEILCAPDAFVLTKAGMMKFLPTVEWRGYKVVRHGDSTGTIVGLPGG